MGRATPWQVGVCLLLVTLFIPERAFAQNPTFNIEGIVHDAQQAVLPGATVTIQNTATGLTRTVTTDDGGRFVVRALPPEGQYRVRVEIQGFASEVREGLRFNAGQNAVLNFSLKLSSVQETVTVAGDGPPVVLAHCWTGGREVWAPVANRLVRRGHQVVLYDQRGHGSSSVGDDGLTIERLGAELGLAVPRSSTTTILHLIRERTMLRLRGFRAPTRTVELRFEEKLRLELCSAAARVYTVEENPRLCGWGAEIASIVAEECFWSLDAPIVRITTPHIPLPAADKLEDATIPSVERIVETVRRSMG